MARHAVQRRRFAMYSAGFTLVELLVVITIIGVLVGLLVPAVQAARESSRRTQCASNVRQLGLGAVQHENTHGFFPSSGWGFGWVGDPDRGYGTTQPGGWLYSILPFCDEVNTHDNGVNQPDSIKKAAVLSMVTKPIGITNCPTRRRLGTYPGPNATVFNAGGVPLPDSVARCDYAISTGSAGEVEYGPGPAKAAEGASGPFTAARTVCNGISYESSEVRLAMIKDGASNTLLMAEKFVAPAMYNSSSPGDSRSMFVGMSADTNRHSAGHPYADKDGTSDDLLRWQKRFGGPHSIGFNTVFCDGSMRRIAWGIELGIFQSISTRAGADYVDPSLIQ